MIYLNFLINASYVISDKWRLVERAPMAHLEGKSLMRVLIVGDEMEEKGQLEEQMRAVMDKFKYKRRQIRELQEDLQTMSNTLDNLNRDEEAYDEMICEKEVMRM